jgi:hypothetical protein
MARKGVACTLASVVLFTMLLMANSALVVGEGDLAETTQLSHLESHELLLGDALIGEMSIQVLAQAQSYLTAQPADCSSLPQYLEGVASNVSLDGDQGGVTYAARAEGSYWNGRASDDNLTVLAPFEGADPASLNMRVVAVVNETAGGGTVTRFKQESHLLHVLVAPESAAFLCASALGGLGDALSASPCNATVEAEAFSAALPPLVSEAGSLGFTLNAGWSLEGSQACYVSYWITLVEPGVEGVTGDFDWTVLGSGGAA